MTSEELKFLMMAFDHIQTVKTNNPSDPNLTEIESLFYKHAPDYFSFQTLRLSEIYESSLEETIKDQASKFYNNFISFPFLPQEIKEQLVADYYQMELQRRRNNFERFSQCIFQQIECITTHFWKNGKLLAYVIKDRQKHTFAVKQLENNKWKIKANNQKPLLQSIVFKFFQKNNKPYGDNEYNSFFGSKHYTQNKNYSIKVKIRAFLYYICFNSVPFEAEFNSINMLINELYLIRNLFHRGPEDFSPQQKLISQEVRQNKPVYFLKFYGLLSEFMSKGLNSENLKNIL
ncbi:MAG: hypothetical protein K0R59_2648 [Sphingobacterium sp.]|jgi:hypothetical protein|nr:hypothetical protein [Sphingobacterium sp.]